jgi:hypothetical protein
VSRTNSSAGTIPSLTWGAAERNWFN